jgi:glycosyltransferase involved in cell wall biosynthesis
MKLIFADPNVTYASPSTRAWLGALPHFRHLFDEIEIWATECDLKEGDGIVWRKFPQRLHYLFHTFDFERKVLLLQRQMGPSPHVLMQCTGCYLPVADIRYMHFWNRAMLEERSKRPETFVIHPVHRLLAEVTARRERKVAKSSGATRWWWVVGRSIADRINSEVEDGEIRILPNQYDPTRFNEQVRLTWRDRMRVDHGFSSQEKVLVFSAFGHFERKGLLQAIQAINILREEGLPIRLLVIGGTPRALVSLKRKLATKGISIDACVFTGLVDNIERHLVAADGFLFPSHFEAFSLAEIECAALGLRLYLTPHYGTEMILREPVNGRFLPWDPTGMAAVIRNDIENGSLGTSHLEIGEAVTPPEYASRIVKLYEEAIAVKQAGSTSA